MTDNTFYKNAAQYWAKIPATLNGVLGGFAHISDEDIEGSKEFLQKLFLLKEPPGRTLALDCGAGIGRVSINVLIPIFDQVDIVEQDTKFVEAAKSAIGEENLGTVYNIGLQDFIPGKKYDIIWCQWVLGHLNDYDMVAFLKRCSKSLAANGLIVIKDNVTGTDEIEYDEEDSSVARPIKLFNKIFDESNFIIVKSDVQRNFPDDIYAVHMFAIAPTNRTLCSLTKHL